jgi:ubiquitin-conjugating enzyme E2 variant
MGTRDILEMAKQSETHARPPRGKSEPFLEATFVLWGGLVQVWGWTRYLNTDPGVVMPVVGCLIGWLIADAISGIAHFLADNFGNLDTPILGRTVISTFREHHSSPTRMLEHGLLERNGWNFFGASLIALPCAIAVDFIGLLAPIGLSAGLILSFTNQIHAWAHSPSAPQWVGLLQQTGFFLSPDLHRGHHAPFDPGAPEGPKPRSARELARRLCCEHYCISSGFWDRVFSWTRRDAPTALGIPPNRSER